jgi:hypothetical protein
MADQMFYTPNQITKFLVANGTNMTADYSSPTALLASQSAVYTLYLPTCLLERINGKTIQNDIIVTVYPKNGSPSVAGSGSLQISSLDLLINSYVDPMADEAVVNLMEKYPYTFVYNDCVWRPNDSVTLTANQTTEITIQPINKLVAGFFMMVRASKSDADLYDYEPLGGTGGEWSAWVDLRTQNGMK